MVGNITVDMKESATVSSRNEGISLKTPPMVTLAGYMPIQKVDACSALMNNARSISAVKLRFLYHGVTSLDVKLR